MTHWKNPNIDLGIIKSGTPKKVVFEALPDIPKIESVKAYCGCTAYNYDETKKELVVTYSNSAIPMQVTGPQNITKQISITYNTGTTEILTIKAVRIRP